MTSITSSTSTGDSPIPLSGPRTWTEDFRLLAGTVIGREHVRLGRNNQDGLGLSVTPDAIVAVVTDGCSSGRYSEIGARLGARWLSRWAPRYLGDARVGDPLPGLGSALLAYLAGIAVGTEPEDPTPWVADCGLFTFLVIVVRPDTTWILGLGDGLYRVDERVTVLDPGEDNAPEYLGYGLVPDPSTPGPVPRVLDRLPTAGLGRVAVATDGASELPGSGPRPGAGLIELTDDERFALNPAWLHKRLRVLGEGRRLLGDDTTVAFVGRREAA